MADADTTALIESLRRANRRWKALALGLLGAIALVVLSLAVVGQHQLKQERAEAQRQYEAIKARDRQR